MQKIILFFQVTGWSWHQDTKPLHSLSPVSMVAQRVSHWHGSKRGISHICTNEGLKGVVLGADCCTERAIGMSRDNKSNRTECRIKWPRHRNINSPSRPLIGWHIGNSGWLPRHQHWIHNIAVWWIYAMSAITFFSKKKAPLIYCPSRDEVWKLALSVHNTHVALEDAFFVTAPMVLFTVDWCGCNASGMFMVVDQVILSACSKPAKSLMFFTP